MENGTFHDDTSSGEDVVSGTRLDSYPGVVAAGDGPIDTRAGVSTPVMATRVTS